MPQKSETPHNGGASRNGCGCCFGDLRNIFTVQTQFSVAVHNVRPGVAVIAALAFGGHGHV